MISYYPDNNPRGEQMFYIVYAYTGTSSGNMYTCAFEVFPVRLIFFIKISFQLNWEN